MRKVLQGMFIGMVMLSGSLQARDIVPVQDLSPEQIHELGEARLDRLTVEVCAGLSIPVDLSFGGDTFCIDGATEDVSFLEVRRTFFVECRDEEHFFSWDQEAWYPLSEFSTGEFRATFEVRDGSLRLILGGEVHAKVE